MVMPTWFHCRHGFIAKGGMGRKREGTDKLTPRDFGRKHHKLVRAQLRHLTLLAASPGQRRIQLVKCTLKRLSDLRRCEVDSM